MEMTTFCKKTTIRGKTVWVNFGLKGGWGVETRLGMRYIATSPTNFLQGSGTLNPLLPAQNWLISNFWVKKGSTGSHKIAISSSGGERTTKVKSPKGLLKSAC